MFSFPVSSRTLHYAAVCFLLAATAFTARGQASGGSAVFLTSATPAAAEELEEGSNAFRNARYDEAIAHFQRAVELDPDSVVAKLYLGTALSQNVVPGLETPDNLKIAHQAIDLFNQILEKDPNSIDSMREIAGIYFAIKQLDDAREWQK